MYMVKWVAFSTFKTLTFAFKTCFPSDHFSRFPRLTLVLTCAMKFNKYPHDEQICKLSMESCKFSSSTKWSFKFEKVKVKNVPNNDESFSQCRTQQMTWYLCGSHQKRSVPVVVLLLIILVEHFFSYFFFKVSNYLLTLQVPLVVDEGIELPQVINSKHNLCYQIWANTFCVMWSAAGQWS